MGYLPDGILQSHSDLEMKPLWVTKTSQFKVSSKSLFNLVDSELT